MAFAHGKAANLVVNAVDLSTYLKETGLERDVDTDDVSALGATAKAYIAGLVDGSIPLSGMFDPAADAVLAPALGGAAVAFTYGPQGTTSGNVKYTGNLLVQKYSIKTGIGGAGTFSATLQVTGAVTRSTF